MELVPPNSRGIAGFTEDGNVPTKKVKVQVTFLVRIFAISSELVIFLY